MRVESSVRGPVSNTQNGSRLMKCAAAEGRQPEDFQNKKNWTSFSILVVAFLLTAAVLFLVLPRLDKGSASEYTLSFSDGYDLIANNMVQGNGYRFQANASETMMREPGYPLFLAGAFRVGGNKIATARWANWLLTIGIAFLLMRLAHLVTNDRTTALMATLLFLLYPSTVIAEARGSVEILFIFAVMVFMLLLHHAVARGQAWRYLIAGLALGVVVQVRSTPLVFPFLLLLYLLLFGGNKTKRLKAVSNVAVLSIGMVVVMIPWVTRNYMLVRHFVPTASAQGVALQEGQYVCQNLTFENDFYAVQRQAGLRRAAIATELGAPFDGAYYYQVFFDPRDEWAFNRTLLERAKKEYADRPTLLAGCACKNLFNFWFLGKTWHATGINILVQVPLLVLALGGLFLLKKRGQLSRMGLILIFILSILAVHLPTIAHARHSVPLVPFLAIPASVSLVSIWIRPKKATVKRIA
jgi:4-amino-4-deoxy-L-arabinose transferase-like glycosyltransferase